MWRRINGETEEQGDEKKETKRIEKKKKQKTKTDEKSKPETNQFSLERYFPTSILGGAMNHVRQPEGKFSAISAQINRK